MSVRAWPDSIPSHIRVAGCRSKSRTTLGGVACGGTLDALSRRALAVSSPSSDSPSTQRSAWMFNTVCGLGLTERADFG